MPGSIKPRDAAQPQWTELAVVKRVVSDKTTSVDTVFKQIKSTKELGIFDRFLHFLGKHGIFSGNRWVPVAKTDEGKFVWTKVETLVDKTLLSKKEIQQVLKGASKTQIAHDMHTALSKKDAENVCRLVEQTPVNTDEIKAFLKNAVIDSDVWMKELSKKQFKAKPEQKPLYEALILYVRLTSPPSSEENKAIARQLVHQTQLYGKTFDDVQKTIQSNQFLSSKQKASISKEVTEHAVPSGKKASTALSDAHEFCRLVEQTPVNTDRIKDFLKNAIIDSDIWMKELSVRREKAGKDVQKQQVFDELLVYVRCANLSNKDEICLVMARGEFSASYLKQQCQENRFLSAASKKSLGEALDTVNAQTKSALDKLNKKDFDAFKDLVATNKVDKESCLKHLSRVKALPEQKPLYEALILCVRLTPPPSPEENKAIALQLMHQAQLYGKTFDDVQKTIQSNQFLSSEQKASMSKELTDLQSKTTRLQKEHAVPSGEEEAFWKFDEKKIFSIERVLQSEITRFVIDKDGTFNVQEYTRLVFQAAHFRHDMLGYFAALANAQMPGPNKNEALTALFAAQAIAKEQESF